MAVANATGNTPTCVPTVSSELSSEKQRHGRCKCAAKHTNVCAQTVSSELLSEKQRHGRWKCVGSTPTGVPSSESSSEKRRHGRSKCDGNTLTCVPCKLRIIIRETTAWPLQMCCETHQRVCPPQAPNYYQRNNGMAVGNALGAHQRACPAPNLIREATARP
jgi:hypothetical protein